MAAKKRRRRKQTRRQSWWQRIPGWGWVLSAGIILILIGLGASGQSGRAASTIDPSSPVLVAQGQVIYAETCAVCHGENGEGLVGSPLNGSAHSWHHVDNQLRSVVRDGIPNSEMPPHGEHLTAQEIDAVLSFIKTWWTPEQQRMQRTGRHPMG